jgi:hypothetical protein
MIQKRKVTKIFALTITLGILVTLIISAPAHAYILRLDAADKNVSKGELITFDASVQVESQDRANVTSIQLKLIGPLDIICSFKPNGEIIEGCDGIKIQKLSNCSGYSGYNGYSGYSGYAGYNSYGYSDCGYGDSSQMNYEITFNTSVYFAGKYKTSLVVMSGNNPINTFNGEDINIIFDCDGPNGLCVTDKYCSIRAKNGDASVDDDEFGLKNKINFYIPQKGARPGEGYITGQQGRTTFSYKFVVGNILEKDENHTAISVYGKYKVGIGPEFEEKSVLLLDKVNGRLDVLGKGVSVEYMDVNFKNGGC